MKQKIKWEQRGDKLCLWTNEGLTWWQLPTKLKDIHPDLLFVAECLLNYPYYKEDTIKAMADYKFTRKQGSHPGLCFSGGIDSLAAKIIMPEDTRLIYHKRELQIPYNCNYEGIKPLFEKMDREVYVVRSNSDVFRMVHGQSCGYSTDYCCGLGLILMADYLDLGYFATGIILTSAYLSGKGIKYCDLTERKSHSIWVDLFKDAGLEFYLPVASLNTTLTTKIINENKFNGETISCYRGTNCNDCIKCYRQSLIDGNPIEITPNIKKSLDERPLNNHALYSIFNKDCNDRDFSWIDKYYPPAFIFIPDKFKAFNKEQVEKYAKPMDEPYLIEQIDLTKNKYPRLIK